MTVRIRRITASSQSPTELFARALDIDDRGGPLRTPRIRALTSTATGSLRLGESVTWHSRHLGLPVRMTTRVTALDEPRHFVDEQESGPFRHYRHSHRFEPQGTGCLMIDELEFEAPGGPLGRAAERLVLAGYLARLLDARNCQLVGLPARARDTRAAGDDAITGSAR